MIECLPCFALSQNRQLGLAELYLALSSAVLAATLTLYHGRVATREAINKVEGVAVLNLGGTAMVSHFFDCHTSQGSPSDLRWSKEEGMLRFPTGVVGSFEYPDGQFGSALRMDLAPIIEGVAKPAGPADVGVYICTDTSVDPPLSASINITGGKNIAGTAMSCS